MENHHHNGEHHLHGKGQKGKGSGGYCTCSKCGYSVSHPAGVPCKTMVCPNCNAPLSRTETMEKQTSSTQHDEQIPQSNAETKHVQFPKVGSEKCTACGICIEICPMETIHMKDNKAWVEIANCTNCRECMQVCPVDAFILE